MTLHVIESRTDRRHDVNQRRQQSTQPRVISGETFRRDILGWSKGTFYAAVKAGRFTHLRAVHLCSRTRSWYVLAEVERFVSDTPALVLRPSGYRKR